MFFWKEMGGKELILSLLKVLLGGGALILLVSVESFTYESWTGLEWLILLALVFTGGIAIFLWSSLKKIPFYLSLGAIVLAEFVFLAACYATYTGYSAQSINMSFVGILVLLGCAVIGGFLVYFLPTILAFKSRKINRVSIFVLNLFLGWSLIFWAVSLAWALKKESVTEDN